MISSVISTICTRLKTFILLTLSFQLCKDLTASKIISLLRFTYFIDSLIRFNTLSLSYKENSKTALRIYIFIPTWSTSSAILKLIIYTFLKTLILFSTMRFYLQTEDLKEGKSEKSGQYISVAVFPTNFHPPIILELIYFNPQN